MSNSTKVIDPALQGAGQRIGTEIWRIENFQPVPVPKSEFGKFYSGDSYIVLQTTAGKGGAYLYDIHFWLGKDTSQDEAGTAAIKTVELDTILGGRAVQYRELQGYESEKFLSYFKPCIIPLEGGVASGFKKCEEETFEPRLYICKGRRVVKLKQVPFSRSSLNHDDVFILDTEKKIYQFNGANSNIQERAKALEVIQYFKEKYHDGTCEVAIIEDGKLVAESDSGEFWVLFGGFAPIGKKTISEDDISVENTPGKLYSIAESQPKLLAEDSLSKALLENNQCYLLDCGSEVFIWVGRITQVEERKAASQAAEEFITSQKRPKSTRITRVIQGYETHSFKSKFESWPLGSGTSTAEEGRGKVAALLKQQGVDVKGKAKGAPIQEDVPPLLESGGRIEVWRINGSAKSPVSKEDLGKFYSGDCYIVLYTYHSGEKKEEYFLCCWLGKESLQDDQNMAIRLANTMHNSLRARPVMGRISEGKEPPQLIALFNPLVVLKGGLSTGYKKTIAEKGSDDKTYSSDSVALFRVSGALVHNNKVVQVDAVATSLNSNDCFLLQSGSSMFTWHGNSSTYEQQQLAAKTAEFLKPGTFYDFDQPGIVLKHAKEGTENSAFWGALGGKQSYTSKNDALEIIRDPHLYAYTINKGKFEITEIFNFAQDDLLTEDMLILGTHAEVFVWIGHSVDAKEKQRAFEIGQMYIDLAASLEGLSTDAPLFKITEGNEPCFFTTYFSWDSSKAMAQGNSFEKKLFLLFGTALHLSEHHERSNGLSHGGPTQRASALAALNSAFNSSPEAKPSTPNRGSPSRGSQRAAAVAALSNVLTAEQRKASDTTLSRFSRSPSSADGSKNGSPMASEDSIPEKESEEEKGEPHVEINESDTPVKEEEQVDLNADLVTLSYEQLKAKSTNPAKGIDIKRREAYLSVSEFQTVLGMTKEAFYRQPKWKQDMQKRKVDLF